MCFLCLKENCAHALAFPLLRGMNIVKKVWNDSRTRKIALIKRVSDMMVSLYACAMVIKRLNYPEFFHVLQQTAFHNHFVACALFMAIHYGNANIFHYTH